jgi:hypothetical protein
MSEEQILEADQKCNGELGWDFRNMITTKIIIFVVIIFLIACQ